MANGYNATNAYMDVHPNASLATANKNVSKFANEKVQEAIKKEQEKIAKKLDITKESLLKDLIQIKRNPPLSNEHFMLRLQNNNLMRTFEAFQTLL